MARAEKEKNEGKTLLMVSGEELQELISKAVRNERKRAYEEAKNENEVAVVSRDEAAKMLCVNLCTLWRWTKTGYLVPRKVGSKVLYLKSDIEKLIMRGK